MDFESSVLLVHWAFRGFTDRALKALLAAREQAAERQHEQVAPAHLLLALAVIEPGPGRDVLDRLGVDLPQSVAQLEALLPAQSAAEADDPPLSPEIEQLLVEAKAESVRLGHRYVGTEHLVLGMLRCGACPAGDYLRKRGVTAERFREEALRLLAA